MVVFADWKKDTDALPPGTREVRGQAGNTIPMVFVTTADGSKGLKGISYAAMSKDIRGEVRDLSKELEGKDVLGGGGAEAAPVEAAISEPADAPSRKEGPLADSQRWTNSEGREIVAAVEKVENGEVYFKMPNGALVPYPLEKLSVDSRLKIEALR